MREHGQQGRPQDVRNVSFQQPVRLCGGRLRPACACLRHERGNVCPRPFLRCGRNAGENAFSAGFLQKRISDCACVLQDLNHGGENGCVALREIYRRDNIFWLLRGGDIRPVCVRTLLHLPYFLLRGDLILSRQKPCVNRSESSSDAQNKQAVETAPCFVL